MEKNINLDMNLEIANLEIKTTQNHRIFIRFLSIQSAVNITGKLEMDLEALPRTYRLHECMNQHSTFSPTLTSDGPENVWTIRKDRDSDNVLHIVVDCNGNKVNKPR